LNGRCRVINAAVAPDRTAVRFDFSGSVVGHVTDSGVPVPTVTVAELLRGLPAGEAPLIKVDIEGFESRILPDLIGAARASRAVVVIELHPQGLNGLGDPAAGLELLRAGGAVLTGLDGRPLPALNPADFTQVVARWA
jgi:hypothetical protein